MPVLWPPESVTRAQRHPWLGSVLSGLSWLYGLGLGARREFFDRGWARVTRLPWPVCSVGGIHAGGVGKTPVVAYLARRLEPILSEKIAILTRGYGHRLPLQPWLVRPEEPARQVGDEPALLCRWLPQVPVVVDAVRSRGARACPSPTRFFLLDDGFQHRSLHRDLDLVLLPPDPRGALLPRGFLREPLRSLERADLLWIHEDGLGLASEGAELTLRLGKPMVRSAYRLRQVVTLGDWGKGALAGQASPSWPAPGRSPGAAGMSLSGGYGHVIKNKGESEASVRAASPVALLTAVARGERVLALMREAGYSVVGHRCLADHHPLDGSRVDEAVKWARGLGAALVITEKDAIKLWEITTLWHDEVRVVCVNLEILEGETILEAALAPLVARALAG